MSTALQLFKTGAKVFGKAAIKNAPTILTALGCGGIFTAVGMAIAATPKAMEDIHDVESDELHAAAEIVKQNPTEGQVIAKIKPDIKARALVYVKHYWPTALVCVSTAGCFIAANSINLKRNAALVAAYQLATMNLKDLKEKIVETDGEKKLTKYNDSIAKDKMNAAPISENQVVLTNAGENLCLDAVSGRYFKSDIENIRRAVAEINKRLYNEGSIPLNEFYDELGLDHIDIGYKLGWRFNSTDDLVDITYSSLIASNGQPCLVMQYDIFPVYDFDY